MLLLLNKDAYAWLGYQQKEVYYNRFTLIQMVVRAWLRAIRREYAEKKYHGLVHFPHQGYYQLNRNRADFNAEYDELTERAFYLAKERSKDSSDGQRSFGCSQL